VESYLDVIIFLLLVSVVMSLGMLRKDLARIHHELIEIHKELLKKQL
jgi:hypothetical protein